jgi:hypothetical protein
MRVSSPRTGRGFSPAAGAVLAVALALVVMLVGAAGARAELVFWDNADDAPGTIGWSNLSGAGGGTLVTPGSGSAGIAYDPVTNRIYVANDEGPGAGQISWVAVAGGGGTLTAPEATVNGPKGVVLDPTTRTAYWLNSGATQETISWARLDGTEGGVLNLAGATVSGARRLALDPASGRLFWGNGDGSIEFAAVSGIGGGTIAARSTKPISGLAYDPAGERLYWVEEAQLLTEGKVWSAAIAGGAANEVAIGSAPINIPWGLAFDPASGRLYWANKGNGSSREAAIGFANVLSLADLGVVAPAVPAVNGPQDPLIVKSPSGVAGAPPVITPQGRVLTCSPGSWAPDYVSSFVYQSPSSYSYQWLFNEAAIDGATQPSYTANASGRYKCVVTASNPAGSSSWMSGGVVVTITMRPRPALSPAKLVLLGKARKLKAKPGAVLRLKVVAANQGTAAAAAVKVCLKVSKKARRALEGGKCQTLGPVAGGGTASARLHLKVRPTAAPGAYRLKIRLPGTKATKVTVRVRG